MNIRHIKNKIRKINKKRKSVPSIIKESDEERINRIHYASATRTRVLGNKKKETREQLKEFDRKSFTNNDF